MSQYNLIGWGLSHCSLRFTYDVIPLGLTRKEGASCQLSLGGQHMLLFNVKVWRFSSEKHFSVFLLWNCLCECCRSVVLKLTHKTTENIFSGLIRELETENWKRKTLNLGYGESVNADSTFHDVKKEWLHCSFFLTRVFTDILTTDPSFNFEINNSYLRKRTYLNEDCLMKSPF